MRKLLLLALSGILLWSCGTQKATVPEWIGAKPIDARRTYVYGVGMSYINPNTAYQQAARSNALADLAGEVESQVFDESRLLQKEDVGGFSSSFSSQTLTTSHIKLEGYELVDTYSDELRYYVLYKLDLPQFLEVKAKNDAIAMTYIDGKLEITGDSDRPASNRFQALADALQKEPEVELLVPSPAVCTRLLSPDCHCCWALGSVSLRFRHFHSMEVSAGRLIDPLQVG